MENLLLDKIKISFVHVGLHKTGSTYLQLKYFPQIQNLFQLNDSNSPIDKWFFENFININPLKFNKSNFLYEFDKKIKKKISNKKNIFYISDENLSGDIYTGNNSDILMERIKEVFGETKILIVIRNQLDWLLSVYSNYVNLGGVLGLQEWLKSEETEYGKILDKAIYTKLINKYINHFGNFVPY